MTGQLPGPIPPHRPRPFAAVLERLRSAPPPALAVAGRRDGAGWKVVAHVGGFQVTLPPAAARQLAAELIAYAELCEGKRW